MLYKNTRTGNILSPASEEAAAIMAASPVYEPVISDPAPVKTQTAAAGPELEGEKATPKKATKKKS